MKKEENEISGQCTNWCETTTDINETADCTLSCMVIDIALWHDTNDDNAKNRALDKSRKDDTILYPWTYINMRRYIKLTRSYAHETTGTHNTEHLRISQTRLPDAQHRMHNTGERSDREDYWRDGWWNKSCHTLQWQCCRYCWRSVSVDVHLRQLRYVGTTQRTCAIHLNSIQYLIHTRAHADIPTRFSTFVLLSCFIVSA